jgi:uncharacterized glyoxalase superfamily protein PhnB
MTETSAPPVSRTLYPALRYADAKAAISWLEEAFGFRRHAVYENEDGSIAHAELLFGDGMIMLGSDREDDLGLRSRAAAQSVAQSVYAYVEDVDAHFRRASAAGAQMVRDLTDTPYGSREYSARDLEGQLWSFGTYRP